MRHVFYCLFYLPNMYKAVFIDIDGTLIKSDHSISPSTIATIARLREKGILVILVSARPLHGITTIAQEVGLSDAPIASLNGGYIVHGSDILFESYINASTAGKLYEQLAAYKVTLIWYQQQKWFAELSNQQVEKEQKITSVPIIIEPFRQTLNSWEQANTGPNKILIVGDVAEINSIQNKLQPLYRNELNMYTSKPIYLEVMNLPASKTNAIKFLISTYGINREETIAIGDNFNDKEMIEFAGLGVAMGNAPDEVKAAADFVTDTNNNDGVRKALEKLFNLTA